jgi:hypothetical protein
MKKLLIIVFVLITVGAQAQSKTYPATLKKYLEVSGSLQAFKGAVSQMMGSFKGMYTSVPAEVWTEFEKEFSSTSMDDLVALLAPVYEKHLTEADLNEVIKFYSTPAGKKLAEKTPGIMQDSMSAGQTWGMKIAEKVQAKLKEKGY